MQLSIYDWALISIVVYAFLCYLIPYKKISKKVFVILASFHLGIIQGFRADFVGGDLTTYQRYYNYTENNSLILIFEPGYNLVTSFLSRIGLPFQAFILFVSIFVFTVLGIFIYKYSKHPLISFILYLILGMYDFGFSGLRQTIAMSIILIAFNSLLKKQGIKYNLLVLLASMFHITAIVFLVLYPICNMKMVTKIYSFFYPIIFSLILILGRQLAVLSLTFFNEMYISYYNQASSSGFGLDEIMMIALVIGGSILYYIEPSLESNKLYKNLLIIVSLSTLLQLMTPYAYLLVRFNLFFQQFTIIFIPYFYDLVIDSFSKNSNNKKIIRFLVQFLFILIFIGLTFIFYNNIMAGNPHKIVPHYFYWEVI